MTQRVHDVTHPLPRVPGNRGQVLGFDSESALGFDRTGCSDSRGMLTPLAGSRMAAETAGRHVLPEGSVSGDHEVRVRGVWGTRGGRSFSGCVAGGPARAGMPCGYFPGAAVILGLVDIDWPADFGRWLDRLEAGARSDDSRSRTVLTLAARALSQLRELAGPPDDSAELATLRKVRQSRRYQLWRVSHAYQPGVAVRLICWFPPESATVVIALFAAENVWLGDVFYDSVADRADPLIDQWKRETSHAAGRARGGEDEICPESSSGAGVKHG